MDLLQVLLKYFYNGAFHLARHDKVLGISNNVKYCLVQFSHFNEVMREKEKSMTLQMEVYMEKYVEKVPKIHLFKMYNKVGFLCVYSEN